MINLNDGRVGGGPAWDRVFCPWSFNLFRCVLSREAHWEEPVRWDWEAAAAAFRPRVFCDAAVGLDEDWQLPVEDAAGRLLWHLFPPSGAWSAQPGDVTDKTPVLMPDLRKRLLGLVDRTPNLDWLVVTSRPSAYVPDGRQPAVLGCAIPDNLWVGARVASQEDVNARLPDLLRVPAAVRFLDCRRLNGPIEFSNVTRRADCVRQLGRPALAGIGFVVLGGPARTDPGLAESVASQCRAVRVPVFFAHADTEV